MNYKTINTMLMLTAILLLVLIFIIYNRAFEDNVPNCDGYLANVFLYILLGLLLLVFSVLFIAKRGYPITFTKGLIGFVVAIAAIFGLYMINPKQVVLNHIVWVLFLAGLSLIVYNVWRYSVYKDTMTSTLIIVLLLVAGLVGFAFLKPDWISLGWGPVLTVALFAGILAWVIPMLFGFKSTTYQKALSAIFVLIFALLVLYDTKLLREKAKVCRLPNYPLDSVGMILDIVNLFSNITVLRG